MVLPVFAFFISSGLNFSSILQLYFLLIPFFSPAPANYYYEANNFSPLICDFLLPRSFQLNSLEKVIHPIVPFSSIAIQ